MDARGGLARGGASRASAAEAQPYKVELAQDADGPISLYTQGDFTDLCRGPHLQNATPIKAVKLTSLAGAYWRGDEKNTQLTRIYGTAFYSQEDLDAYLERLEQARARDHRRIGTQLDLFHLSEHSPGSPFWHPKGMVVWNALEDLRRRENRRRGYSEVKTPLLYDLQTYITSGHYENYEENMFFVAAARGRGADGAQADELPRPHAAVRLASCARTATCRSATRSRRPSTATSAAGRSTGSCASSTSPRTTRTSSSPRTRSRTRSTAMIDFVRYLYDRFGVTPRAELSTRPEKRLGTDEQWDRAEGALEQALQRHGMEYVISPGEGTFYGPKIDLHMTDVLGRSWQMGTIQLDYQMPMRFGLTYMGAGQPRAHARSSSTARSSARSSGSSGSSSSTTRALPVLALAGAGARRPRRRGPSRRGRRAARSARSARASARTSTSATRRSASASARRSSRRSRSSSSTATGSPTTRSPCASGAATSRRSRSPSCSDGSRRSPRRPIS